MIFDHGAGTEPVLSRSKSHIYGSTSGAAAGSGGDEVDNHLHTVNLLQFQSSQTIYNIHLTFLPPALPLHHANVIGLVSMCGDKPCEGYREGKGHSSRCSNGSGTCLQVRVTVPEIAVSMDAQEFQILQDVAAHLASEQVRSQNIKADIRCIS